MTFYKYIIEQLTKPDLKISSNLSVLSGEIGVSGGKAHPASFSTYPIELKSMGWTGVETPDGNSLELKTWLTLATNAKTLAALETILSDFSNGTWALVDKAALSDAYTPIAKKLIENESASKWQVLENLACLCFKPST